MLTRNRRAVLDGLVRILDAGGLEELFAGPDEDAAFVYDLLQEAARARGSSYYWEICRTARRRGVTPDYVVDRATVLLAAMRERQRTDLYRILGVPPLSSGEMIRQRWLAVAKRSHPDVGGDGTHFRRAKEAYEALRDPGRRAEYERFWLRAVGPFDRIAPAEEREHLEGVVAAGRVLREDVRPVVEVWERNEEPADDDRESAPPEAGPRAVLHAAARLFAQRDALDRSLGLENGKGGLGALLEPLETGLSAVSGEEIESLRAEVERGIVALEACAGTLRELAAIKRRLGT